MKFVTHDIKAITIERDIEESDVPCTKIGCTLCCEILSPYLTEREMKSGKYIFTFMENPANPNVPVIAIPRIETGCIYFGADKRCKIYNDRPLACRQFDCRKGHHPKIENQFEK
jgi:Fe-S-cluster containining protein